MIKVRTLSFRVLSVGLVLVGLAAVSQAGKPVIPAQKPVDDVVAVSLFEAMEARQLDVKLVHKDEASGNLFVENTTDQQLNVQMPEAFVGVHVLNQGFFGSGNGSSGFGSSGLGNQSGQSSGQGQGGQTTGGGTSGSNSQNSGIFSVPPGKIVRVPVHSVCLEHGRPTPSSRMEYRVFPVEKFSQDPALYELLSAVADGKHRQKVVQAAAWHMASEKSWKELAAMKFRRAGNLPDAPHFTPGELVSARKLAETSQELAETTRDSKGGSLVAESVVVRHDVRAR
jgi:hypothetical protein